MTPSCFQLTIIRSWHTLSVYRRYIWSLIVYFLLRFRYDEGKLDRYRYSANYYNSDSEILNHSRTAKVVVLFDGQNKWCIKISGIGNGNPLAWAHSKGPFTPDSTPKRHITLRLHQQVQWTLMNDDAVGWQRETSCDFVVGCCGWWGTEEAVSSASERQSSSRRGQEVPNNFTWVHRHIFDIHSGPLHRQP